MIIATKTAARMSATITPITIPVESLGGTSAVVLIPAAKKK